ncbi:MAG: diphosphate--fructose-6-phosphate 1-phosphotransferase [Parachlamydiaceae bacterium]
MSESILQEQRKEHRLRLPKSFEYFSQLQLIEIPVDKIDQEIERLFPSISNQRHRVPKVAKDPLSHPILNIGVVFSGGPAPGGHNVIAGLFYGLKQLNTQNRLIGFLNGPIGILKNDYIEIDRMMVQDYLNQGGFDLIGTGRTKIETLDQLDQAADTMSKNQLDGLVIIGGDDSNTNAAFLAEHFLSRQLQCTVIGVPKTIDGDLQNREIEISFGFDTATKTYAATIGSILNDSRSQQKYTFFIKVMGRSASHVALECALKTHPNLTLIGEEIKERNLSLADLVSEISDLIESRAKIGKPYGVIIIPEGVVEFIPEVKTLIQEINQFNAEPSQITDLQSFLSLKSRECYSTFPQAIQQQLVMDRDPHGNVQVSKIETERLLIELVQKELEKREEANQTSYQFNPQPIFLGYEGRSCLPSNFDCQYTYVLGLMSALMVDQKITGCMAVVQRLALDVENWQAKAVPLVSMLHLEKRGVKVKPVIKKALVDLNKQPFITFARQRNAWKEDDDYQQPGPIQFFGPAELTDEPPAILRMD